MITSSLSLNETFFFFPSQKTFSSLNKWGENKSKEKKHKVSQNQFSFELNRLFNSFLFFKKRSHKNFNIYILFF